MNSSESGACQGVSQFGGFWVDGCDWIADSSVRLGVLGDLQFNDRMITNSGGSLTPVTVMVTVDRRINGIVGVSVSGSDRLSPAPLIRRRCRRRSLMGTRNPVQSLLQH